MIPKYLLVDVKFDNKFITSRSGWPIGLSILVEWTGMGWELWALLRAIPFFFFFFFEIIYFSNFGIRKLEEDKKKKKRKKEKKK